MNRAIIEPDVPYAIKKLELTNLPGDVRNARRGGMPHHRVEPRAVEPPSDLLRVKQELVAQQLRTAPRAQGPIGRIMAIVGKCRP